MKLIQIENKNAKVKLNDTVHKYSVDQVIEEIEKVYGMKAVENAYAFGEVTACAENAVDTMEIEIHSPGGSVFEGYRIYNAMKELRERGVYVTAKINTLAASMGSVIAMAADKVTIASNGRIMIHDASAGAHGNAEAMRKTADILEEISDEIAGVYAGKTGKDKDDIRKMMKSETWITAKKAVEMGFADEIFDTTANSMKSILEKFKPDAALTEKVTGLQASLSDAENQITEITSQLAEAQSDLKQAIEELSAAKAEIENINDVHSKEIVNLNADLKATREENENLTASLKEAHDEITKLRADVAKAEQSASAKAAEILGNAGTPSVDVVETKEKSKEVTRAEFNAMTAKDQSEFCLGGGKIIN